MSRRTASPAPATPRNATARGRGERAATRPPAKKGRPKATPRDKAEQTPAARAQAPGPKPHATQDRGGAAGAWQPEALLFPPLDAAAQKALARLPEALERVWPLSAAHRRSLPDDIAALSRALTAERAALRRPYWSRPAFVSAYLYYFLPWNLVRLARLFKGLPLSAPGAAPAMLLDAGSGPLTVPLALWLGRPEWRDAPVRVLALDSASQPLELGRALMAAWGEVLGEPVWPARLERGPLESLAARALPLLRAGHGRPWLVTAANVLNEVRPPRGGRGAVSARDTEDAADEDSGDAADARLGRLLEAWAPLLDAPGGAAGRGEAPALLFVEPGTRLGGTTIMRLRAAALDGGLSALAPCTADGPCPLARGAWCHFTFAPEGAPRWLAELSARAGLAKRSLSLSPLLLGGGPEGAGGAERRARVLSSPFAVPGVAGVARYGCADRGLVLLEDAGALPSGALVRLGAESGGGRGPRRDARSGARILAPRRAPAAAPAERAAARFKKKS